MGISSLLPNTQKSSCSSLQSLPSLPVLPSPTTPPLLPMAHPQPMLMYPQNTNTLMLSLMTTPSPTLKLLNPVMVTIPKDLTESTFLTVVSKLSPILLMLMVMSLMSNTRVRHNTPNTSPLMPLPPLTNLPIRQLRLTSTDDLYV